MCKLKVVKKSRFNKKVSAKAFDNFVTVTACKQAQRENTENNFDRVVYLILVLFLAKNIQITERQAMQKATRIFNGIYSLKSEVL